METDVECISGTVNEVTPKGEQEQEHAGTYKPDALSIASGFKSV